MSCLNPENEKPGGTISLEGSTFAPGFAESPQMHTGSKTGSQIQGLPLFELARCISEFPLRDVGRGFLARGYKPNTIITFQHGFPWPAITTTRGQAAQNTETFEDHNIVRPVFGRARLIRRERI